MSLDTAPRLAYIRAMTVYWTAVLTKQRAEDLAVANMRAQDFTTYLPRCDVRQPGDRQPIIRPLFPRFVFVKMNRHFRHHWTRLRSTRGCIEPIMFGDNLGIIRPEEIDRMRDLSVRGIVPLPFRFVPGRSYRVNRTSHALHDRLVVFQGMQSEARAQVLWHLFGTETKTTIPVKWLEAA